MKSPKKISAGLFGFDRRERRGTYVLSAMLVVLLAVRFTAFRPDRVPDDIGILPERATGLQGSAGALQSGPPLFTFDPNTVSYDDLLLLGLTERQAATLINYRGAGARFRRPEEIARVYGLDSSIAARLIPYVIIKDHNEKNGSGGMKAQAAMARHGAEYDRSGEPIPSSGEAETPAPLIDLNRSSAVGLEILPGIGPVLAARIIKYRNLLGGFVDSRQLTEVYGIDSSVVRLVLPKVTVTLDSVSPLMLDSASFGDLARHPYVGYDAARLITRYRTLADAPLTLGSMVRGNVLTARQAERMAPYVRPSPGVAGTDYEFISSKVLK
ncbi:MAG: helix-hairpin-helix domain-containing protein [Bacteroidales bacterium]|nr:helix-hairpin-helix domain-containing protein [Bacteroidales bacterium]